MKWFINMSKHSVFTVKNVVILAPLFLISCEKLIDWELETTHRKYIVVESTITNELKYHQVRLTWSVAEMNELPEPVSDASITISWADEQVDFIPAPNRQGIYISKTPFVGVINRDYRLSIIKDTFQLYAETYMIPVFEANWPVFDINSRSGLYSINWKNEKYNPIEQSLYEAEITWGHLPGYDHPDSVSKARLFSYTLSTIDVSYLIFQQEKQRVLFPKGAIARVSKYSLTREHAAYLRALLSESQWQGSLFETSRGNLPGNINGGGLGFFSASAVIRQTFIVGQ